MATIHTPEHETIPDFEQELLIREARRRTRRRRIWTGVILVGATVFVVVLSETLGGRTAPTGPASPRPGSSVSTGIPTTNVVNLAGANTITASGSHVWVAIDRESLSSNYFAVIELNAKSGSLVRVMKNQPHSIVEPGIASRVGDLTEPGYMAVSHSKLWVGDDQYWNATELNSTNGSLVRVVSARADQLAFPGGIAISGGHVWIANSHVGANSVTELKARDGSLVRVINAPADQLSGPWKIAISGSNVFVLNSSGDSITELNANTGALVRIINPRAGCCAQRSGTFQWAGPTSLAVSGSHLWVSDVYNGANGGYQRSSVAEFDTKTGALIRLIRSTADQFNDPVAIAATDGAIWVENNDNTLTELNAQTGSLVHVIDLKLDAKGLNASEGMAVAGNYIAILNIYSGQKGSVTVIDARTGKIVRVIQ